MMTAVIRVVRGLSSSEVDPGFHKGGCLDGITESVQWLSCCHCCKWVARKLRYHKSQEAKLYIANIAMKL